MKMLSNFFFAAVCLCFAAQVRGAAIQDAMIVDFGIYKGAGETSVDMKNSPSGKLLVGGAANLVKQTDKIPAKIGVKFGFRFSLSDKEKKRNLKFVYLFPKIKNPQTGQVSNRFEFSGRYNGDGVLVGVFNDFSDPWDLVPGEWTFQVFDGDRMLVEKKFTVVKAD